MQNGFKRTESKRVGLKKLSLVVTLVVCFLVYYRGVDPSEALRLPGVKSYVGVDDVPGHNATGPVIFDEEVFALEKVHKKRDSVSYCNPNVFLTFQSVKEILFKNLENLKQCRSSRIKLEINKSLSLYL